MKKFLIAVFAIFAFVLTSTAQTTTDVIKPELTKEEKAKIKAAKEAEVNQGYVLAGLNEQEIAQVKVVVDEMNQKGKDLKASSLTEEEKAVKKKELNEEKKTKLIAIMGDERYKKWGQIRKELAAKSAAQTTN